MSIAYVYFLSLLGNVHYGAVGATLTKELATQRAYTVEPMRHPPQSRPKPGGRDRGPTLGRGRSSLSRRNCLAPIN